MVDCKSWDSLFTLACLHEWQDLWAGVFGFAAGLLGFLAAIWAVRTTLRSEQRRASRELDALKKGLGTEARHFARNAYEGAAALVRARSENRSLQIIDIENAAQFPLPVLYNGNSNSLGFLGEQTPNVVLFYNQIDVIQQARIRLRNDIDMILAKGQRDYAIGHGQLAIVVNILLAACKTAVSFLPSLKTGTSLDNNDDVFPEKVAEVIEQWQRVNPEIKVS